MSGALQLPASRVITRTLRCLNLVDWIERVVLHGFRECLVRAELAWMQLIERMAGPRETKKKGIGR
jgi:hypothetical protein